MSSASEPNQELNDFIQQVLDSDDPVDVLQKDRKFTVWVDWRARADEPIQDCEKRLQTGKLIAKILETGGTRTLSIAYGSKSKEVPLTENADELVTVVSTLNELLSPEFELRCSTDIDGDGWLYLPLPVTEWKYLEDRYGDALSEHFQRSTKQQSNACNQLWIGNNP